MIERLGDNHWIVPTKDNQNTKHHVQIELTRLSIFTQGGRYIDDGTDMSFQEFLDSAEWQRWVEEHFGKEGLEEINSAVRGYMADKSSLESLNTKREYQQRDKEGVESIPENEELQELVQQADMNSWEDVKQQMNWKLEFADGTTLHEEYQDRPDGNGRQVHRILTKPDGTALESFGVRNFYFPVVVGNYLYDLGAMSPTKWNSNGELVLELYNKDSEDPRYSTPGYFGLFPLRGTNFYVVGNRLIAEYELASGGDYEQSVVRTYGRHGYIEFDTETLLPIGRCRRTQTTTKQT